MGRLHQRIRAAEVEIAGQPIEHVIAFDSAGNEVLRKTGDASSVELTAGGGEVGGGCGDS
jgi:hypothetical protein